MVKDSSCKSCKKYPFCEKQGKVCDDWKRQPYSTIERDEKTGIIKIKPIY